MKEEAPGLAAEQVERAVLAESTGRQAAVAANRLELAVWGPAAEDIRLPTAVCKAQAESSVRAERSAREAWPVRVDPAVLTSTPAPAENIVLTEAVSPSSRTG